MNPEIEGSLYRFIRSRLEECDCHLEAIGGTYDHIHLVHSLPRTISVANVLKDVKSLSCKWMKEQGRQYYAFEWQTGYSTFSLDYRNRKAVVAYVMNQKKHHYTGPEGRQLKLSFEHEYKKLLKAYDCEFDPNYLFPS
ncbi:MAG: transposase [Bacteroidota bacterium]